MSEVDVLRALLAAPAQAEHVAVGQEGMRADQQAAGVEEAVVGEPPDHAVVPWQHAGAAQRKRRAGERAEGLRRAAVFALALYQALKCVVVGPDIDLAQLARRFRVLEVPVGAALDRLRIERAGQIGHRSQQFAAERRVEQLRVGGLGAERELVVERGHRCYTCRGLVLV